MSTLSESADSLDSALSTEKAPTQVEQAYDEWLRTDNKDSLQTCVLRMAFKEAEKTKKVGSDGKRLDDAHWLDVELACAAVARMPGPKPSLAFLRQVAEVLRTGNSRGLTGKRNKTLEREQAQLVMGTSSENPVTLSGHMLSKAQHQAQWLVDNKNNLPPAFVKAAAEMLTNVYSAKDNKSVLDKRQLRGAGKNWVRPRSDSTKEDARLNAKMEKLVVNAASPGGDPKAALTTAMLASTGQVRLKKDGTVDERSAAAKSGRVRVRKDGLVDGRSQATRALHSSSASSPASSPAKSTSSTSTQSSPSSVPTTPVSVSAYTRSDGTQVSGYVRHTPTTYSTSSASSASVSTTPVHVSGYTRSNGTQVSGYTRYTPTSYSTSSSGGSSSSSTVSVSGYTRSNGTYVAGYTRSK